MNGKKINVTFTSGISNFISISSYFQFGVPVLSKDTPSLIIRLQDFSTV